MIRTSLVLASFVTLALAACGEVTTTPTDAPVTPTATVIVTAAGSGSGSVTSVPAGINCGADCSEAFAVGTSVTLTATPVGSATFTGWSGGGCSGTGPCTITVNADAAITATFTASNALDVTRDGTGAGTVTSSPGGINCGSDCSEIYPSGTVVTLTAAADASSSFTGWSGAGCTGTATCVVTVDQARSVNATFDLNRYALTVTRSGTGSGTVTSSPAGISCGADCTEPYDHGAVVTLTAAAAVGSTFAGWTGGGCTGTADCTVTMTAITDVTATFTINQDSLTVMRAGTGSGTVTSSPAGINCGADCGEIYNFGTVVTLTATPAAGSTFSGWSGGGCSGTGTCAVTITGPITVTATFTINQHTLTVTRSGTGTGTVTSSPAGVNCGADCTETYNFGTMVTLTAAPAVGSSFAGWAGGGCTGTGNCTVSMVMAQSVTATFTINSYTLTVTRAGTGSGTVTSSPAGISCGLDCSQAYNHGTTVTLTASPASGSAFAGWSGGGCSGTGTCAVTMTAAASVTATFNSTGCTGTVTYNFTGGLQTFTVPACATSITIDAYGAQGGNAVGENGTQPFGGGLGARIRGTFAVSGGQAIEILVGGRGRDSVPPPAQASCGAGGGGGSFVVRGGAPMVIAGGGGGGFHCNYYGGVAGGGGQITSAGQAGIPAPGGTGGIPGGCHPGGANGLGGRGYYGGGGGGFSGAGQCDTITGGGGGQYPGIGGMHDGGYGGGGGRFTYCCGGSGGGGGYSGGSGGTLDGCAGGGGGSINNGTNQLNSAGVRSGDGLVIISY